MVIVTEDMETDCRYSTIEYTSSHDHEYTTLHDIMDSSMDATSAYTQIDVPAGKPDSTTAGPPTLFSPPLPAIPTSRDSLVSSSLDLDSSVSNLSWLHSLQSGETTASNANPNLLVNPQTVAPVSQTLRIVTLPSNVHLSNSNGHIKYVTVSSSSKQHVYITTPKNGLAPISRYPRTYPSPGSVPSSTVPDNPYPKPPYSYSCLIALSLKNSRSGSLPVAEIYNFMTMNFPYFKTAPDGWKNSVRHNLSLNKCFEKIENPNADGTHSRKGCLWAMNPTKIKKMDEEVAKWNKKDLIAIKRAMANPDLLDILTRGQGAYLMERSQPTRGHSYVQATHLSSRPGVRIVTALPPQPVSSSNSAPSYTQTYLTNNNNINGYPDKLERSSIESIDFSKLAEETAELFGEDNGLPLDPSLSDFAMQNGLFDDLSGDLLDYPLLSNFNPSDFIPLPHKIGSPIASPAKNQLYNNSGSILPIY